MTVGGSSGGNQNRMSVVQLKAVNTHGELGPIAIKNPKFASFRLISSRFGNHDSHPDSSIANANGPHTSGPAIAPIANPTFLPQESDRHNR